MMKNCLIIISCLFLLASCQKEEVGFGDTYNGEVVTYAIDLANTDDLMFDADSALLTFKIGANYWWTLSTEYIHTTGEYESDWFSLTSSDAGYANQPVTAILRRNVDLEDRQVKLILASQANPAITREVILTQKASEPVVEVDLQSKSLPILQSDFKVLLTSAGAWSVTAPSWITLSKSAGGSTRNETITVCASDNDTGEDRNGIVTFVNEADPAVKCEVSVSQSGVFNAPQIRVTNGQRLEVDFSADSTTAFYVVHVYEADNGTELAEQRIEPFDQTVVCDLTELDFADYIGKIYVEVAAHLTETFAATSNREEAHTHFDNASGDGSEGAPYVVSSVRHFRNMAVDLTKHYRQEADLDFSEVSDYRPLGSSSSMFSGSYDGNGKTISQLTLSSISTSIPPSLFAYVSGTVRDLTIANSSNAVSVALPARSGAAMIVGSLQGGRVENCKIRSCVITSSGGGGKVIGGIVGYNVQGVVTGCSAQEGSISSSTVLFAGGIVGVNGVEGDAEESLIESCENVSMNIFGTNFTQNIDVGGIAYQNHHTIRGCINRAKLTGTRFMGGITSGSQTVSVAATDNLRIIGCGNYGAIECYPKGGNNFCGGIVARFMGVGATMGALIDQCFNEGAITIKAPATVGNAFVGGLVGRASNCRIHNSYSTVRIDNQTGAATPSMGGLYADTNLATTRMEVLQCYAKPEFVNATAKAGAIAGGPVNAAMDYSTVYYLSTLPNPSGIANGLTEEQMKQQASYVGWDFTNTWTMGVSGYPTLKIFEGR